MSGRISREVYVIRYRFFLKLLTALCLTFFFTIAGFSQTDYALSFDGVNDNITIPNGVSATFTLEARIKTSATSLTGTAAWQGNALFSADISGTANDFVFSILNNKLAFDDGSSGTVTTVGSTAINDGAWHHVAVVRTAGSPGTVKLYIDGVQNGSTGVAGSAALTANTTINIGGVASHYYTGYMDEIRVWNAARTTTQINSNKNSTLVGNETNLYKYLNLNDGTGSTANNLVSGQTDGTLNNMTTTAATSTTATSGWVFVNCTGLWSGATSTNWTTASNWCSGTVPTSTTDVVIPPVTRQPTISSSVNCNDLNITSGATLTTSSAGTLIITGNITSSGTMTNSGTTNFNGTSAQIFSGVATFNNLTLNNTAGLTLGGSVTINGDLTITTGTLSTNNYNISLAGDLTNNGGFTAGSGRVTFTGATSNTVTGTATTAFNTITVNKGTDYNSVIDVQSLITMSSGGLTLTNGTFKLSSSSTITPFTADITTAPYRIPSTAGLWVNGGTVSTTANITSAGLIHASAGTLNIGDAADEKLLPADGSAITIDGGTVNVSGRLTYNLSTDGIAFTISSGTFNVATVGSTTSNIAPFTIVNAASSFTMSGGTIVIMKGGGQNAGYNNNAGTSSVTGGTLQIGSTSTLATDTIQISSTPPIWNLTVNSTNAPVAQLTAALVVLNNITISGGKLDANNLNLTVGGNWANSGSFLQGTATVTFNGTTTISGSTVTNTFNNLTVAASSTVTCSSGITGLVVNGTLTTGASATLDLGTTTILSGTLGTISNSGTIITSVPTTTSATPIPSGKIWGGTIDYANASANQTVVGGTYNNLTVRPGNAKVATASGNLVVNGALTVTTAFGAFDLSTYVLSGSLTSITNNGDIRTSVPTTTSATPIPSGKTWGGTVYYNATTGAQTVVGGTYNIIRFSNTSGTNTASGDLTVNNQFVTTTGGTLDMGSSYRIINMSGAITNNGTVKTSVLTTTTSTPFATGKTWGGTGMVEYAATTGAQTVVSGTYNNLKLSNTSGTEAVGGNITVGGVFTLTGGTITTGVYSMYINSTGSVSRTSGHVIGNLKKNIATGATTKTFEVGDATNYTPATVTFASVTTTGDLSVTVTATDHPNLSGSGIRTDKSANRYFTLTNSAIVFTTATLTINWVAGDVDAGATTSNFNVGNYNSSTWTLPTTASPLTTSIQATGLTTLAGDYTAGERCALSSGFSYTGSPYCSSTGSATPTISGTAGTFTSTAGLSISSTTGVVNLSASTAGTYTVTNSATSAGGCTSSSTASITIYAAQTTANAGADQTGAATCGLTTVTLAGNTPSIGTGAWSIISGSGGTVTTPTSATSTFTGTAGTTYTLRWTISNGTCTASTDDVIITFNANPTIANAGADQTGAATCGLTTVTLAGNAPSVGTGAWSIISGTGGTVNTPSSATSTFTGTAGSTYTLRWTTTNGSCTSTDDVIITFNRTPTTSNAGPDQSGAATCGITTVTLAGNAPSVGSGAWSVISGTGGTVSIPSSATSTFTGTAGSTYTLRWTTSNSPCTASTDDVIIAFGVNPTTSNAGPDQTSAATCGLTTVTLAGNAPSVGSGAWSIISGTGGTVTTTSSATSTFTGTAGTTYTLRWTTTNGSCTSTDDVIITFNRTPTTANAGPDQTGAATCGLTTVTLAGNTPSVGTGAWSIISGAGGTVNTPSSATSTFTGTAGTTYTLRWTISNSPCTASTDDVIISFNQAIANNFANYTAVTNGVLCAIPDENGTAALTAPTGSVFTTVGFASYGTPTGTCSSFAIGNCNASNSQSIAESYLLGNNTASIPATNTVFGDPCNGTVKKLYVQATYSQPICSGTSPGTITGTTPTGGTGTYTYYWEMSTTSSSTGFAAASGTNNAKDYVAGTLTQTTWFRRTVTSGSCSDVSRVIQVTVSALPAATISYAGNPYCSSAGTATVTRTGTAGGTYSSTTGLVINATTGDITLASSTAGTYTVTYTMSNGACTTTATASVTITTQPFANGYYAGNPYCSNGGIAYPTGSSAGASGTLSSTTGLTLDPSNGVVTLGTSTPGTYTVTYTVPASGGCAIYTTSSTITISAAPSATISYVGNPFCITSGTAAVTRTGTAGGTYSSTAGLSINSSTGDITLASSTAGTYTVTYTVAAASGCAQYTTTTSVTISATSTWSGAVSNNWNTSGNWSCNSLPGASSNVVIPTGLSTYPVIASATTGTTNNITVQSGATLTVNGTLQVAGTITNSGTFTATSGIIVMNGSSAQTIAASTFAGNIINALTVNNTAGITLGGALGITDALTISAGSLTTGGYLTLKSSATANARVAPVTSVAATPISGNVTVERYVPGRRRYRLITSSVTTSASSTLSVGQEGLSIWGNWQNSGNNTTGNVGTYITGGNSTDGFDTQTANASLFTYDDVNRKYIGFTTANGKNTKYTPLKAGIAYYMFVYGDRTKSVTTSTPNNTVLSATGTLLTGDQTYNTSSAIPLSNVTGRYTLLGNPFASPIDWGSLPKTNLSSTYWGWDPNLSSTGGYITVSTTGTATLIAPFSGTIGLNQYIQAGQGFFVKTTASSPSLTIRETDKVSNFNSSAFRTASPNSIPLMAVNLQYYNGATKVLADGALAAFDDSFSMAINDDDASKLSSGTAEEIAIDHASQLLSIDARPMPQDKDTVFLNVTKLTKPQYILEIFTQQLEANAAQPYLEDAYLNTSIPLSVTDTNRIVFDVTSASPASSAADRFRIVFKQADILPVTFTLIQATAKEKSVQVDWKVASESGVQKYAIERSADGINFKQVGEVAAKGSSAQEYNWLDVAATSGNNYYRVRAIYNDGKTSLTKTVVVKIGEDDKKQLLVFPNPILNQQIKFQLRAIEKGQYTLLLYSSQGQVVLKQVFDHRSEVTNHLIQLDKKLAGGMYYLHIAYKNENYYQSVLVQ